MARTVALVASLLLVSVPVGGAQAAAEHLNVVIILADDLGYGDLGCYGHPKFKTPNLDRMAAEGARLTNFYSTCPYCAPSRASLLTGRYPFRSGLVRNPAPDAGVNDIGIPDSEVTLGEALKSAGYRTGCIGKWHLGHKPQFFPTKHGFDEYFGILYSNDMHPVELMDGEKVVEYPVVQATLTQRYAQRAVDFIERHKAEPFFLFLAHAMPHKPLAVSEGFYKGSGAGLYGDAIAELDWSVGRLLAKLKELNLDEKTLVVFTSDNGAWYGGSTGGLRGMKGLTWEGGIRVPLLARRPGKIPAAHVSHAPAALIDLLPTVLTAAGLPLPAERPIDGKDIMALFTSDAPSPHEALFSMKEGQIMTVRSGQWKLHVVSPGEPPQLGENWVDPRRPDGVRILAPYEQARPSESPGVQGGDPPKAMSLFDLSADAAEQHDVAAMHPDVVERLKKLHDQLAAEIK